MNLELYPVVKFLHILSVVFMSVPFYNLIIVNERALFGPAPFAVDRYMENLIKKSAVRCYVFQFSALVTGILLLPLGGKSFTELYSNPVLAIKFLLLILLMGLLSIVHFGIQPRIEAHIAGVTGTEMPKEVGAAIKPLRTTRRRLAGLCLFVVITIILLGLQVYSRFPLYWTGVLAAIAALFAWRAFSSTVRLGWI